VGTEAFPKSSKFGQYCIFFAAFQLAAATVYTIHAEVFGGEEHVCLNFSPVSKCDKDVSFAATQHCLQFLVCLL